MSRHLLCPNSCGGFGIVYKGKYEGNEVAIKQSLLQNTGSSREHVIGFEDLATEVDNIFSLVNTLMLLQAWYMSSLRHPNLVQLIGVCMRPLCVVVEYISCGDLYHFLHSEKPCPVPNCFSRRMYDLLVA